MSTKSVLSKIEIRIYFALWIGNILYAIYRLYLIGNEYFGDNFEDAYNDFSTGWSWIGRKKDNADPEWQYGLYFLKILLPWYLIHFIGAEILRQYVNKEFLLLWYAIVGLWFAINNLGWQMAIYFLIQPTLGYVFVQFKNKLSVWIYSLIFLFILNYYELFPLDLSYLSNSYLHIAITTIIWTNIRCLNYFLEAVTNPQMCKLTSTNVIRLFGYCFYLPLLFYGPLILFTDFITIADKSNKRNLYERLKEFVVRMIRFSTWLFITELALHFIYVNALSYHIQTISSMNRWALYGLGYCMGQFFQMKYVVFYGFSTSMAHFEDIPVPRTPICIGRVHLYSDMWKYFDYGLYLFLLRYIYIPLCRGKKSVGAKIIASFFSFLYVNIWHGLLNFVTVWSLLNFVGITIEMLCRHISKTILFQNKILKNISPQTYRRLTCILITPLFAMSALSNFYFFAGKEVGDLFVYRFLTDSIWTVFLVLIVLYFGSQVSIQIKEWERNKKNKVGE